MSRASRIGVLGHNLRGVSAVGLEDAHRPGGADSVAVKEDHDLPDDFLLSPGVRDPLGPNRANAVTSRSRSGSASMTSKTFSPKDMTIFLAQTGPMPRIIPEPRYFSIPSIELGAEVLRKRARNLLTVGAIVDPLARCSDPFAGGDDGGMAHDGHQIAVAARLRPENTEAVLRVMEGDPLDEPCENFLGR